MKLYDIVIVGAGPAGSALAIHLAAAGYRVALLERERFPRDKVCGDLVSAHGLGLLEKLGCVEPVAAESRIPIREARVFLNGAPFSDGRMPEIPGLPPHGHAIPRAQLDEIIFRRAQQAGADTVEECRVLGFEYQRGGVVVSATIADKGACFAGRMLVGADGARSVVAKTAGLDMSDPRYVLPAVRAYCEGLPLRHAVLCFEEAFFPGYGWIFPIAEGVANIGVGMVRETMLRNGLSLRDFYRRLEEFVRRTAAEHGARVRIAKSAGWVIKAYGGRRRNTFERGILIGEAGCFVDPLTGEGIPLALATARIACDAIEEAFARGDFGERSLAAYEGRWRADYEVDLRISDLVVSSARNRQFLELWMHALKLMAMTAARDEGYALTLGGIMAGLLPARDGLSAGMVLKSLLHGPEFWMQAFRIRPGHRLADLAAGGASFATWQTRLFRRVAADPLWSARWAAEILGKEFALAAAWRPRVGTGTKSLDRAATAEHRPPAGGRKTLGPSRRNGSREALVLGATGHIGNAVVRELLARGWSVTAASRRTAPPANLTGLPLRFQQVDDGCPDTWIAGHELVVDAAAPYPIHLFLHRQGSRRELLERAADRTRTLVSAVRRHGVRLAYVGSFAAQPPEGDPLSRLRSGWLRRLHPYFLVKRYIEEHVLAAARQGLPAVIVNPTVCIGPWDLKPRPHCLIPQLLCGEVPGLVHHELNVIDVRDVASALVSAVEAKRWGEVIPLGGHDVSSDSLVNRICELGGGVAPPRFRLSTGRGLFGTIGTETLLNLAGVPSPSPALATMLVAESGWKAPSAAQTALGVWPRPLSRSLIDAIDWYRELGYC